MNVLLYDILFKQWRGEEKKNTKNLYTVQNKTLFYTFLEHIQ